MDSLRAPRRNTKKTSILIYMMFAEGHLRLGPLSVDCVQPRGDTIVDNLSDQIYGPNDVSLKPSRT